MAGKLIKCTRRIEFDAGHRIIGHGHKCRFLHGHRYVLEVTAGAERLDSLGMVVDFSELKSTVKNWIDENLDHNTILHAADRNLGMAITKETGQNVYYLKQNPTAENIAFHLKKDIIPLLFANSSFKIIGVKLYETPNCYVEVDE